ncbi:hypothetical protein F2Q68_00016678 [Brassica cretica]|uniref:Uncharacterized protein n=1 Tax=Brassica cretica TaxID=69181 RepID=A0A8S9HI42_BRACR|nr:hypothetical protein F2Q68_00016678 [Brassica cretica]
MVDSSWTSTDQFNEIGSVWKDSMRKIQLIETRNLRRRDTSLHSELEALRWAMESILQHSTCQRFETYCKDLIAMITDPQAWSNSSTELEFMLLAATHHQTVHCLPYTDKHINLNTLGVRKLEEMTCNHYYVEKARRQGTLDLPHQTVPKKSLYLHMKNIEEKQKEMKSDLDGSGNL